MGERATRCWHTGSKQNQTSKLLFIIRVKRELKRVYRNGCRYNERLNAETGGSKTPRIHWVVWVKHTVNLVLVVTQQETVVLVRHSRQ